MKVFVDSEKCQGHTRCNSLVPEVFDLDDNGYAVVREPSVPAALEERVRRAVQTCPEGAIRVEPG